jgi:hypothetical protein
MQPELFEVEKITPIGHCRNCIFRQVLNYGGSGSFSYCMKQKNGHTRNNFKKIKASNPACQLFQRGESEFHNMR